MESITAKELMTTEVVVVNPSMSTKELSELFTEKMISGAPVVDEDGTLLGVVSLSDLARNNLLNLGSDSGKWTLDYHLQGWDNKMNQEDLEGMHLEVEGDVKVEDIMTPMVFTAPQDLPLTELARAMSSGQVHRLIITDNKKMLGIVTSMDILKAIGKSD